MLFAPPPAAAAAAAAAAVVVVVETEAAVKQAVSIIAAAAAVAAAAPLGLQLQWTYFMYVSMFWDKQKLKERVMSLSASITQAAETAIHLIKCRSPIAEKELFP